MSLLPLLVELSDELSRPSSFGRCNNFGRGVHSHELDTMLPSFLNHYYTGYQRHPRFLSELGSLVESGPRQKAATIGKDGFQVCMDVQQFAPNEISVKTVDNTVVVEANHEEREDEHGYISRQFKRRYTIPEGFNVKDVVSQLSSDGILTIKAPPEVKAVDQGNVRVLQIQQTGPARLNNINKETPKPKKDGSAEPAKK